MQKKHVTIIALVIGAILLWLLWRNREKVAPQVFNVPQPNYLDVAYPQMQLQTPSLQAPISGASCGCNPQASQFLSNTANSVTQAENAIEEQLKKYVDSMNAYFATQTVQ